MNIRNWGLGSIMQLPDCVFGRRFMVSCSFFMEGPGTAWDISELALPERCVLWELVIVAGDAAGATGQIRIALGDQLPTAAAMMDVFEPLFPGVGLTMAEPRVFYVSSSQSIHFSKLRQLIESQGRRLVVQFTTGPSGLIVLFVGIVVSSVPTEVPDCLVSEYLRSQS